MSRLNSPNPINKYSRETQTVPALLPEWYSHPHLFREAIKPVSNYLLAASTYSDTAPPFLELAIALRMGLGNVPLQPLTQLARFTNQSPLLAKTVEEAANMLERLSAGARLPLEHRCLTNIMKDIGASIDASIRDEALARSKTCVYSPL